MKNRQKKRRAALAAPNGLNDTYSTTNPKLPQRALIPRDRLFQVGIPRKLKQCKRWVLWKKVKGGGKWKKCPCDERGNAISIFNNKRPLSFNEAIRSFRAGVARGDVDGIGFVFTEDGFSGVDIDDCIDEHGDISPEALKVIKRFNSYTEISPSGRGIHILVTGTLPEEARNGKKYLGGKCGVYEAYSSGRFFTITGRVVESRKMVRHKPSALSWFWKNKIRGKAAYEFVKTSNQKVVPRTVEEVLTIMRSAQNSEKSLRLMNGDTSGYPSDSEADLAMMCLLAFYCGKDPDLMEQVFNRSKLACRSKWRNREDYRKKTIGKAIELTSEIYNPHEKNEHNELTVYSAAKLAKENIQEIRWVIPDLLPAGMAILAAKPKKGKSWMCLKIAIACAQGGKVFGKRVNRSDVLYVALEDGKVRIRQRLLKLCGEDHGVPGNLLIADHSQLNAFCGANKEAWLRFLDSHKRVKLIVIDTIGRIMPQQGRNGNQYKHEYDFCSWLQKICIERNICILGVAHCRKASSLDPYDTVSGTLGLTAGADTIWVLSPSENSKASDILHVTGREVASQELALKFKDGLWQIIEHAEDLGMFDTRSRIIGHLRNHEGQAPKKIAEELDLSDGNVRKTLHSMVKAGQLQRSERGVYCLPAKE